MKFKDILKKVGSSILRDAVPGGGLILDAVNAMLPSDKKLPADATGQQARNHLNGLPPEVQVQVLTREFDVELEEIKQTGETARAMLEAEAASTHTTRPYIAKGAFHVVAVVTLIVASLWAYGVATGHDVIVGTVMEGWPFILALIGPFVALLHAYFGILRKEHKTRVDSASGGSSTGGGIGDIISAIVKRK